MSKFIKGVNIQPNRTEAHTDVPLTNIAIGHYQSADKFVADSVFPVVPVSKSSGEFYEIPRGSLNRLQVQERARGAKPVLGEIGFIKKNYKCSIYGLKYGLTDEDDVDFDEIIDWENQVLWQLANQARLNREIDFANNFFKAGVWGTDKTGIAGATSGDNFKKWSDDASDPISDIKNACVATEEETGFKPNSLTLSRAGYIRLTEHPEILDRIKYGQTAGAPALINKNTLATVFDVDEVLVAAAINNTEAETTDKTAHTGAFIMGNNALLTYKPPVVGKWTPAAGYTFAWNVYGGNGFRIRTHRDEEALTDFQIMDDAYVQKTISSDLGILFSDVI